MAPKQKCKYGTLVSQSANALKEYSIMNHASAETILLSYNGRVQFPSEQIAKDLVLSIHFLLIFGN